MIKIIGAALLLVTANSPACTGLTIDQGWVREPPPGATVAAAFMTLRNNGAAPITITAVSSRRFAHAMLHQSMTVDGTARMVAHETLVVAPHNSIQLAPGGLHLMLMQPNMSLRKGQQVEIEFDCGGHRSTVDLPIRRDLP
ncbi:MAG: copper chaperone PCu(A)C [Gammaproteobacteria bacterium]|nr:copper chaperone PCu(A)C [Gammaproteobacteria bacterium]